MVGPCSLPEAAREAELETCAFGVPQIDNDLKQIASLRVATLPGEVC